MSLANSTASDFRAIEVNTLALDIIRTSVVSAEDLMVELPTVDFRKMVMNTLLAVHKAGVHHDAFNEAYVVVRAGDNARLLAGFGSADEHACHLDIPIEFYAPQPHSSAVGCEEVFRACVVAASRCGAARISCWSLERSA